MTWLTTSRICEDKEIPGHHLCYFSIKPSHLIIANVVTMVINCVYQLGNDIIITLSCNLTAVKLKFTRWADNRLIFSFYEIIRLKCCENEKKEIKGITSANEW